MVWPLIPTKRSRGSGSRRPAGEALPADAELLQRIAAGDRGAFEVLYRRYHRRLFGFLGRWLDPNDALEEVLDDVLFTVWTDASKFEGRSRVSTWIFGIAYRQAMAQLRRVRTHASLDEAPEPRFEDTERERWELRSSLAQGLETLSDEHRAVVELTYYEGLSYREIADVLGCPENTVKTRMFHARRQLRSVLPELGWRTRARVGREAGRNA